MDVSLKPSNTREFHITSETEKLKNPTPPRSEPKPFSIFVCILCKNYCKLFIDK